MFINIYMCYGLNIVLNWIVLTLCSVTTPFLLEFDGSVDYQEASYVSSFSFVIVYLVVGGLTKTLTVPAVLIVSYNALHRSNQKNLSFLLLLFLYLMNFTPCGGSVPSAVHWNCNRFWSRPYRRCYTKFCDHRIL